MEDWFFRPLLYIQKVDDVNLQNLAQSIFSYMDIKGDEEGESITKVSKDHAVHLITHLLTD